MYAVSIKHNTVQDPETGEYRLQVWVHEHTDETDPNIFVYQRKPVLPDDHLNPNPFSNIAAVGDVEEYPVDEPFSTDRPFFRKSFCDIIFKDPELMSRIWLQMKGDVNALMDNLNSLADPTEETEVVI